MRYIDVHTHVNLSAFQNDTNEVIARAHEGGVWMVNVGTGIDTSRKAVALATQYDTGVYATVGLHPLHTAPSFEDIREGAGGEAEVFSYDEYLELAKHEKVVAIGECGLDYFHTKDEEEKKKQMEVFEMHIALANEVQKPLMLHLRSGEGGNAYKDALPILKTHANVRGDSHFFAGALSDAEAFWAMGYSTSFTGVITFTHEYDEVVHHAPKDLIHAETDAPYVAPVPFRGKRNEPLYVREVVARMARIRNVDEADLKVQLVHNASDMFGIGVRGV